MVSSHKYSYTADALRIIAIIAVITIHISGSFVDYPPYFHGVSWWFANIVDAASRASVPLFIMLSGVLILDIEKTHTPLEYFKKRIKRVGIPLLVWSVLYILWEYFYWFKSFAPIDLVKNFLAPNIYYHLYFLYVILGLYIVAPILRVFIIHVTKKFAKYLLICLFIFVSLLFAVNKLLPTVSISFNGLNLFLPYIPYFVAGHYLWQQKITKKQFWIFAGIFVALFLLTAVLNEINMIAIGWTNTFSNTMVFDRYFYEYFSPNVVLMSLLGLVMIRNIPMLFPVARKPLYKNFIRLVAPLVFGMYLIHPMIIDVVERYMPAFNLAHIGSKLLAPMLVGKIIVVVGISFVLVFIGRKIKYLRTIFG